MSDDHPLVARYMKAFERALEIHDVRDGRDIAVELKGHIDEALASGDDEVTEGEEQSMGWTIGDIVTALGENGLATVQLRELYSSPRFTTPLDDIEVDAQIVARVPGILLLEALLLPRR